MKTPRKPGLRGESVPVQDRHQRKSTEDGSKDNQKFLEKAQKHGLTREQVAAFKEVFDLFDEDGGGTIDADELDAAMKSVDCAMTPEEIAEVLSIIDEDGNGEIDFDEFLVLMTSTEKCMEAFKSKQGGQSSSREEPLFLTALTRFMKKSALPSLQEIERYYANKVRKAPHVIGHYTAGARLIGLTEKQLLKHFAALRASNTENEDSPYAQPLHMFQHRKRDQSQRAGKHRKTTSNTINLKTDLSTDQCAKSPIEEVQDERNPSKKPERAFTPKEKNRQPDPNRWFGEHIRARSGVTPPTLDKSLKSLSEALTVEDMPVIRAKVSVALVRYYRHMADKRDVITKKHWDDLSFQTIQSDYLQKTFKDAFETYTAGQTINIPWIPTPFKLQRPQSAL